MIGMASEQISGTLSEVSRVTARWSIVLPMAHATRTVDVHLCGWRVRSDVPLPQLAPWHGDSRHPDIRLRWLRAALDASWPPGLDVDADGSSRCHVPGLIQISVDANAREVVVTAADTIGAVQARFLLTTTLAVLSHRRHFFPLQASCVRIQDRAVVLAGPPASGKSTLAALLATGDCAVVADDVTVVAAGSVQPVSAWVHLWRDAMDLLGLRPPATSIRPGLDKYGVERGLFRTEPVPIYTVCHLGTTPGRSPAGLRRLGRLEAVAALGARVWLRRFVQDLGADEALVKTPASLVDLPGGHWQLDTSSLRSGNVPAPLLLEQLTS